MVKKIIIIISIAIIIFGSGYGLGYWRSNQMGDVDSQNRIAELKKLNSELDSGYTKLRENYIKSEARLSDFLTREADRNRRATETLGRLESTASAASGSIGRAISGFDRLSEAIGILLGDD